MSAKDKPYDCVHDGKRFFAQKKYMDAIRVMENCRNDSSVWEFLGLAYSELFYIEDAKTYLKKAIMNDSENTALANAYLNMVACNGKFKQAVEEFRSLLKAHPADRALRKALARALVLNKEYDEAIHLYRIFVKEDPLDYESRIQIGALTFAGNKSEEALAEFLAIIQSKPARKWETEARLGIGQVFQSQGKYKEAYTEYEKVLQIDPQNKKAAGCLQQITLDGNRFN
ncbi:MAG: tetratricopeptide repeat protein [Chitinispirillaceae bacterium]|jgi:tetratricopeptide (TPR) repeat protein|nr:tetratricopeptide repeat protein [Chitinispirillaceae bacterium]